MQRLSVNKYLPAVGLAALLAAGGANAAGTISVNIEPNAFAGARVLVVGPAGANATSRNVTADQSLSLPPGRYSIVAVGVRQPAPIVDNILGVVNRPAVNLMNGRTVAVTADYRLVRPGSGRLWIPVRMDGQVQGFSRALLKAGTDGPALAIANVGSEPVNAIFDGRGNMWVASFADSTVLRYNATKLAGPGTPIPDLILRSNATGSLNGPVGLAFDSRGNLWVGNFGPRTAPGGAGDNTVVRFTPQQIARTGRPTPAVILRGFANPYGHSFDAQGNLWVGNSGGDNVLRFPLAEQVNGGTPDVTVTATTTDPLSGPRSPVFDQTGNLWVASAGSNRIAGYTVEGATVTPFATLGLQNQEGGPVASPDGLAFDNGGHLWVGGGFDGNLYRYVKADLDGNGAIRPIATISNYGETRGILFSFNPSFRRPAPPQP